MSISIITFANLGKKTNIPTVDIAPVIDVFARQGELDRVICQVRKDFYFPGTISAVPTLIHYGIRAFERITGLSFPRSFLEALFDFFAQWKIPHSDAALFHGGYFLPRTFRRAQRNKTVTIDLTRTAHIATNAKLEQEELSALQIPHYQGIFTRLYHKHEHYGEFDYIIALSDFVKRSYIEQRYPVERIFVAQPDVDTRRFTPALGKDSVCRVLYVGYTTPLKGLHYLLDAWESLSLQEAELVLVGGYGDMPQELKLRYKERVSRDARIKWIASTDMPERYYHDASIFVFPSLTEGFGRVTLEAMASGLPVITTENARGIVEDGKTGFVVPVRDAKALAEKIRYLYDHRDVVREMGREARKAVEAKKPFGEAVYEIYREILRREHKL